MRNYLIETKEIWIDSLVLFILLISIGFVLTFSFGIFRPIIVFLIALLCTIVVVAYFFESGRSIYTHNKLTSVDYINIAIFTILALVFRYEPYPYVMGGQDQGVYVNMASSYADAGKPFITDELRSAINNDKVLEIYDENNHKNLSKADEPIRHIAGRKEGAHLPGVYVKDLSKSQYVFQFYHLHSLWMAFFTKLFGVKAGLYSLTFFSLLSIVAFYLLSYEITGNRIVSSLTTLLLIFNPLHVFFSKWPVSEIVALSFTTFGFYYLVRFWNSSNREKNSFSAVFPLIISALCFGCFFFTRISGFMYVPFFLSIIIVSIPYGNGNVKFHRVILFSCLTILVYFSSVIYGLLFSYPYSIAIYRISFSRLFGSHWRWALPIVGIIIMVSIGFLSIYCNNTEKRGRIRSLIEWIYNKLHYILYGAISIGIFKFSLVAFTDIYIDHRLGTKYGIANIGWEAFNCSSIFVSVVYLSPIIFLIFLVFSNSLKQTTISRWVLYFLLLFWTYIAIFRRIIPYQYYYARYLLTEIIPFTFLAVGIIVSNFNNTNIKRVLYISIIIVLVQFTYYTGFQLQGVEAKGAFESLNRLHQYITSDDLLLLNRHKFKYHAEIKTPLVYIYKDNVFDLRNDDDFRSVSQWGESKFNNIYFLSQEPIKEKYLQLLNTSTYRQAGFERVREIPKKYHEQQIKTTLYLYKVKSEKLCHNNIQKNNSIEIKDYKCLEISGFYSDKIWTNGEAIIHGLEYDLQNTQYLLIETFNYHPYRTDIDKLKLRVFINEVELKFKEWTPKGYVFIYKSDEEIIRTIKILSSTFSPIEEGINNDDNRKLGIDVRRIKMY